jgi:FkbM family methyltransferase
MLFGCGSSALGVLMSDLEVHAFENGVKVYQHHLAKQQKSRYAEVNLHEPVEEEWFIKSLKSIQSNRGVFLDVGAAIGYYVILAKHLMPQLEIHAVEPLARHRQYLCENLRLNHIDLTEVVIHSDALSASAGTSKFMENGFGSALVHDESFTPMQAMQSQYRRFKRVVKSMIHPAGSMPGASLVTTTTLDSVAGAIDKPVDLVKLDVQGLELEVLKGACNAVQRALVKTWIIGTHSQPLHAACRDFLVQRGYGILFAEERPKHQPDGILVVQAK